jgi:hypothetical protein
VRSFAGAKPIDAEVNEFNPMLQLPVLRPRDRNPDIATIVKTLSAGKPLSAFE